MQTLITQIMEYIHRSWWMGGIKGGGAKLNYYCMIDVVGTFRGFDLLLEHGTMKMT